LLPCLRHSTTLSVSLPWTRIKSQYTPKDGPCVIPMRM
jgi:hypothetical protein